jgi:hypothetical protein
MPPSQWRSLCPTTGARNEEPSAPGWKPIGKHYEVLQTKALGRRLCFKRDTMLAYCSRRNYFCCLPHPNRQLAIGPIWYERSVSREPKSWEEG